jgi:hypothetical protein
MLWQGICMRKGSHREGCATGCADICAKRVSKKLEVGRCDAAGRIIHNREVKPSASRRVAARE